MKNPELFNKTVGILVKAYQNDTLVYCDCQRCAVGNLLGHDKWGMFINMGEGLLFQDRILKNPLLVIECEEYGYSIQELAYIEQAFAIGVGNIGPDDTFNGLMAVVDTLMQIHEATIEEAQEAKELFVKIPC